MEQEEIQPKKAPSKNWTPWILAFVIIGAMSLFLFKGNSPVEKFNTSTTQGMQQNMLIASPSPFPLRTPTSWQTIRTFKGNGILKTAIFFVSAHWRILWSCDPSTAPDKSYNLSVEVDSTESNAPLDPLAMDTTCKSGNTSGVTEEYKGGNVYLGISSSWDWSLTIQEAQY